MSLKCYSDWQLGAIQNDLTPSTDLKKLLENLSKKTFHCKIPTENLENSGYVYISYFPNIIFMNKKFLNFLILLISFLFLHSSCAKKSSTTSDNTSTTSDNTSNSDNQTTSSDEAPNQVVFTKSIMDPDATQSKDYEEWASEVIQTSDGGYVVVGRSISWAWPTPNNVDDILIVKLDGSGNIIWNNKIHLRNYDRATSVVEDNEGNYVLTGFTSNDDSDKSDVFFAKVNIQGNVLLKTAIKITNNYDGGYSISKTSDGGYIIGGEAGHSHNEDFMMLKVDQNGVKQWSKRFSDQEDNSAFDALEANDGNFYLVGSKRIIYKYEDIRIIKTNSNGKKIWDKNYGGNYDDIGEGIIETENNTFVVAASTFSYGKAGDAMLMKINSDGDVIWQKNYGGDKKDQLRDLDGNTVSGRHLSKTPDGGFLVSGYTNSFSEFTDMWVFKTNKSGLLLWNYNYQNEKEDYAFSAKQAVDGSVIIAGATTPSSYGTENILIVKIK